MLAVRITAPGQVEVDRHSPRPTPSPGQVLLSVSTVGICGTDLTILAGHHPRARWPLIPGHEVMGVITAIESGPNHGALEVGQRVVVNPLLPCDACGACLRGRDHVCENLRLLGIDAPGGLAEYMAVDADRLVPVPDQVSDPVAALTEPLAVAVRALRRASSRPGDQVVVLGAGPIGLLVGLVAREAGAGRVVMLDVRSPRVEFARGLGFEAEEAAAAISEHLQWTFDAVFECSGNHRAIDAALALACAGGRIIVVGVPHKPSELHLRTLNFRELSVIGTRVYTSEDLREAVSLTSRLAPWLERVVTHVLPLSGADAAFTLLRTDPQVIKTVLTRPQ